MSIAYDIYLEKHKSNVAKGFFWLKENLPEIVDNVENLEHQICFVHDASKSLEDEYNAYDTYFYGNASYAAVQEFKYAWLRHIHRNPHHWQYWVLHNDDAKEGTHILDMPYNYIIEMICDWWSFSWDKGDLYEIFKWYDEHKEYMKLGDKTRKTVEGILNAIKEKLTENTYNAEFMHHGVKGQKWGVQNGPPYPIDRSRNRDTIVKDAIASGQVSKTVNPEKQMRHTKDGHKPGRSYIDGDLEYAQELVDELSGTGEAVTKNGKWLNRERVVASYDIGIYANDKGNETESNTAMIVYSKTGTHIYPVRRKENEDEN